LLAKEEGTMSNESGKTGAKAAHKPEALERAKRE
jgi:hypothetical protein